MTCACEYKWNSASREPCAVFPFLRHFVRCEVIRKALPEELATMVDIIGGLLSQRDRKANRKKGKGPLQEKQVEAMTACVNNWLAQNDLNSDTMHVPATANAPAAPAANAPAAPAANAPDAPAANAPAAPAANAPAAPAAAPDEREIIDPAMWEEDDLLPAGASNVMRYLKKFGSNFARELRDDVDATSGKRKRETQNSQPASKKARKASTKKSAKKTAKKGAKKPAPKR